MTDLSSQSLKSALVKSEAAADWTDLFDRSAVIVQVNELIDILIEEICRRDLPIHRGLEVEDLALLYRFPIHVGVNIFIERLLRVAHSRVMLWSVSYPDASSYTPTYFKDTNEAVVTHYYDFGLNYKLLNGISRILGGSTGKGVLWAPSMPKPQEPLLQSPSGIRSWVKETMKAIIEWYVKTTRPPVVGEYSNWMREILPMGSMLRFTCPVRGAHIDVKTRAVMRECCRAGFLRRIDGILGTLEEREKRELSDLFADSIDRIIPRSVVEDLPERFSFFQKVIKKWDVKQVHSFIGYYYSENFKVFAILARRKGALLIGHAHGASNPASSYKQCRNELAFIDFYFAWGKDDCTWLKEKLHVDGPRIISVGSAYLAGMKKWRKENPNSKKIVMLYPSGPLMNFMGDFQEITPEEHYLHRLKVISLLKALWRAYPSLKVLYKPFPGTFASDPVRTELAREFEKGSIELVQGKPSAFFATADMVLWDTVSTGFCESLASGIPAMVFQPRYEYEQGVLLGKKLDRGLLDCGVLFFDIEAGENAFKRIMIDRDGFLRDGAESIRKFQEATAFPVSGSELKKTMKAIVPSLRRRFD